MLWERAGWAGLGGGSDAGMKRHSGCRKRRTAGHGVYLYVVPATNLLVAVCGEESQVTPSKEACEG